MFALAAAIPAVLGLMSQAQASQANMEARKSQQTAIKNQKAQQLYAQQVADAQYRQQMAETAPARARLKLMAANDPNQLTPDQEQALQDQQQVAQRGLAITGLRGSGKAQAAVLGKIASAARQQYVDRNTQQADLAALTLNRDYSNAADKMAATDYASNNAISQLYGQQGTVNADATTANAQGWGQALGGVGAAASQYLMMRRPSAYGNYQTGMAA